MVGYKMLYILKGITCMYLTRIKLKKHKLFFSCVYPLIALQTSPLHSALNQEHQNDRCSIFFASLFQLLNGVNSNTVHDLLYIPNRHEYTAVSGTESVQTNSSIRPFNAASCKYPMKTFRKNIAIVLRSNNVPSLPPYPKYTQFRQCHA
jgi:hypothetical protein